MYEPLEAIGDIREGLGWNPGAIIGHPEDLDVDARVQHFFLALSEHPAIIPHLNTYGVSFGLEEDGRLYLIPDLGDELLARLQLDLWRDPAIRPLFEEYNLTVYEG